MNSTSESNILTTSNICLICLHEFSNESYVLDDCKHKFCKECLIEYVNNTENVEQIDCPFNNQNELKCENFLSQNEIRKIIDKNSYEKYLVKKAKVCRRETHDFDEDFKELLDSGCILKCPRCNIPLEKYESGCDFIRCFNCKLDICWLTRQPRWGPNGKGDTTSGCQCGLNGLKCHPNCRNCH